MKSILKSLALSAALVAAQSASALVIDTNGTWDGSINSGWASSGQSLTVDNTSNTLNTLRFYFSQDSIGRTFNLTIMDAVSGGNSLFSSNFQVTGGDDTVVVNTALTGGSTVYAEIDYLGYVGDTAHFSFVEGYAGGDSFFEGSIFSGLDHRFIAVFSDGQSTVPEPSGMALAGIALIALARSRKWSKSSM